MSRCLEAIFVIAILALLFLSLFLGAAQMGIAYDELFHIPAGATFVDSGLRRSTTEHTPLGHWLTGLALTAIEPWYSRADYLRADFSGAAFDFGYRFFKDNESTHGTLLAVARLPLQLMAVLGAAYTWLLARSLWGKTAGIVSLLLVATCPLYVGWSRYVYLDGLLAATMIATLAHLVWFLRGRTSLQLVLLGATLGASACAKYSGFVLVPFAGLLVCLPGSWFGAAPRPLPQRLKEALIVVLLAVAASWLIFGCPRDLLFYFRGYQRIYSAAISGYRFYLLGEFEQNFWYFYPLLFGVKSTLATLAGVATAGALLITLRKRVALRERAPVVVLLGAALLFLLLTSYKSLPIGARYLTPMYPALYVAIGWVASRVVAAAQPWPLVAAIGFLLHHISSSIRLFPDEMAYYNELVGGPARGIYVSNDASLDAGQHLPRLARYLKRRGNPTIKLRYQGTDVAERYGIRHQLVCARLRQARGTGASTPSRLARKAASERSHRILHLRVRSTRTLRGAYFM
jgi:hypothetical protein